MKLSDLSVQRPVLAAVMSLLIIAFGAISFFKLPLRELPDVDQPTVSVDVTYRGASSDVVESQVTQLIEDQLSGVEGLDQIRSSSRDGRASINIDFDLSRDLDSAFSDVQAAVARARDKLPADIDEPNVTKTDADSTPIIWLNLSSDQMSRMALSDYAQRSLIDRLSSLDGVSSVRLVGVKPALRVWIDPAALAARGLTIEDVEQALRAQNVEAPAGYVQSQARDYNLRIERAFTTPEEFARLPVGRTAAGGVTRLGEVARVEIAPEEARRLYRGNGVDQVGMGVIRQSKSNALAVGEAVRREVAAIANDLPPGVDLAIAIDTTVFIRKAVEAVWRTLAEALALVVVVIFLFLGTLRAAAIPSAVIPVCLIGAFAVLAAFGYSINLLTLLALVLSIGLVVDDSIVVLENVQRRMDEYGEPALAAAQRGTAQVAFAVIATSAVLIAVFTPLLFLGGYVGRLFIELAATVAGVIAISAFCSLTLTPMMCSLWLRPAAREHSPLQRWLNGVLEAVRDSYAGSLDLALKAKPVVIALFAAVFVGGGLMFMSLPGELTPPEDRGNLFINMEAPEGAGFDTSKDLMLRAEKPLMDLVRSGEATRVIVIAPAIGDQTGNRFSTGTGRVFLDDWGKRANGFEIVDDLNKSLGKIAGATFRARMQNPFQRGSSGDGVSIVLLGGDYETLAAVAERVVARAKKENPRLLRPKQNFEPTSPRAIVSIDRERAAALGVSVESIGRTLEATMGAARINTITDRGEEYYVYLQAERDARSDVGDVTAPFVRSSTTGALIPLQAVVSVTTRGDAAERRRQDRLAAVGVQASLEKDYTLGEALAWLENAVREEAKGADVRVGYEGLAKQYKDSTSALAFTFIFALVIVYLALAAQFESFIHPVVIMLTAPLAVAGGALGLYLLDMSLNIYSQIGLVILIGLAAKNGILIVEFANQLRDQGRSISEAVREASALRLRPILMTSAATVFGALPLLLSHGAGAEARSAIGAVIVFGVTFATMLTLFVVPAVYELAARYTRSPHARERELAAAENAAAE